MTLLLVVGVFIVILCVCNGIAEPDSALLFFGIAIIVTIAIALLNSPKNAPESESRYNEDPTAYEEHQSRISESCSDAQADTSENLYCGAGE